MERAVMAAVNKETFASIATEFLEARTEDERAQDELDRARSRALRCTERVNKLLKQLEDEKWLEGKSARVAVYKNDALTLVKHGTGVRVLVSDAEKHCN